MELADAPRPGVPAVDSGGTEWWELLGRSARIWAGPRGVEAGEGWWTALSGQSNLNYNLACCHARDTGVLVDRCLDPTLRVGKPALIMLSGPGLVTAQKLVESRWVTVGALPLMALCDLSAFSTDDTGVERLDRHQLDAARHLLAECYGLDLASAETAFPDAVADRPDMAAWGLFAEGRLVSCVATVRQDGVVVVWSMATRPDCQKRGYGRRLLETVLNLHFEQGASASLLHSSRVAEVLYAQAGYRVVEYLQLWSRPRWALGVA